MYIYKVTHTSSGQYYIGISKNHKDDFDDRVEIDPMKFFNVYESNGYGRSKMVVCAKSLIAHSSDPAVIEKLVSDFANARLNDPNFLGLKMKTKAEEEAEMKPRSNRTVSAPTTLNE